MTAQDLRDAFIYAYPLVLLDLTREMVANTTEPGPDRAPVNQLFHSRTMATPDLVSLTRPNVDTLYSQTYLDLGAEPMLLFKPATDRYCSIQPVDGYSNTLVVLGSGGIGGTEATTYAFTGPGFSGTLPDDVVEVPMPTDLVWLLLRTLATSADELPAAHAIQDQMRLYPLSAHGDAQWQPPRGNHDPAADFVAMERIATMSAEEFFNRFNQLAVRNPGTAEDAPALARFAPLGVGAGLEFRTDALPAEVQAAAVNLHDIFTQEYTAANAHLSVANGWMYMGSNVCDFGTDYAFRAVVAYGGYANPMRITAYPAMVVDAEGRFLNGADKYSLHFEAGQMPPFHEGGWWSLTSYDAPGHVVANELDRYAVGFEPLTTNPDGSVDVWIQAENPGPERVQNWLPVCADNFSLVFRIYMPTDAVIDQTWLPPVLVRAAGE